MAADLQALDRLISKWRARANSLFAECDDESDIRGFGIDECADDLFSALAALRAEAGAVGDSLDANRYRFIRGANGHDEKGVFACTGNLYSSHVADAGELDAAIDAALAQARRTDRE